MESIENSTGEKHHNKKLRSEPAPLRAVPAGLAVCQCLVNMIHFFLLVNKQGQTRLSQYYTEYIPVEQRVAMEGEIVRKCLSRTESQVRNLIKGSILTIVVVLILRIYDVQDCLQTLCLSVFCSWGGRS